MGGLPPGVYDNDPHFNHDENLACGRCGEAYDDGCDCDPEPDDLGPDAMDLARGIAW